MSSGIGYVDRTLADAEGRAVAGRYFATLGVAGKRVLLVVPDGTRTAPVGLLVKTIHDLIGKEAAALDVMIALGTHPPMTDEAINRRLEITAAERAGKYGRVKVMNHAWDDPAALRMVGTIRSQW